MNIGLWTTPPHESLHAWIAVQRWFGDKSRVVVSVTPETFGAVEIEGFACELIQVRFDFADEGSSTYFVPMTSSNDHSPIDALSDDRFLAWLGSGFDASRTIDTPFGGGARLVWRVAGNGVDTSWSNEPARVLDGEQSNSSILFGRTAIAKVFRKLQPGINPDSEIVAYLTAQRKFRHVPAFLGSLLIEYTGDRESVELVSVQAFVANQGDCWRWLPEALGEASGLDLAVLLEPIRLLGQRTGELHVALASGEAEISGTRC